MLALASGCAVTPPPSPSPIDKPTVVTPAAVTLAAVGDIMLGGSAAPELRTLGYDYPFDKTREILSSADIAVGNLEGPLTKRGKAAGDKQYIFRSPPDQVAPALAAAGFDVVSLANNHIMDYGAIGLRDTLEALDTAGIRYSGAGANLRAARAPAIVGVGGRNVAFLSYSLTYPEEFWAGANKPGSAFGHEAHIRQDVLAAWTLADSVVVSFHWGAEGKTSLRAYQPLLAHAAIDAGAAAVIGHHPHVLQGVERYGQGVILYSLGNFAFGSYSARATRSAIARLTLDGDCVRRLELLPLNVKNAEVVFQPTPLAGAEADTVVAELQRLSEPLGTFLENKKGVATLANDCTAMAP